MQISTTARNLPLTPAAEQYLREHIRLALRRFAARIRSVEICLTDVNGPKGGPDKQVAVKVQLRSGDAVVAEACRASTGAAVAVAIRRAKRMVRRRSGRARRLEKQRLRALGRGQGALRGNA
jgi:ribosome-associated translation inhibitor RaiA